MKNFIIAACAVFASFSLAAQDENLWNPTATVRFETRIDFDYNKPEHLESNSGIHGRYFMLRADGQINSKINYSFRQRLNKFKDIDNDVFSATDWIYLTYNPTDQWAFSGGKQVVAVGSYEYDRNPLDVLISSRFWNNFACYQFGASAAYTLPTGNHTFTAQVTNSPFQLPGNSCYGYNLMWTGKLGILTTMWSVNLFEYERNHYCNYIALGNRIDLPKFYLEFDLMNLYSPHHQYWFDSYNVIARAAYSVTDNFTVFAKGGQERYNSQPGMPNIEKPFYGAGVEWYPIAKHKNNLRFHLLWDNAYDNDCVRSWSISAGVKFGVNLFSYK